MPSLSLNAVRNIEVSQEKYGVACRTSCWPPVALCLNLRKVPGCGGSEMKVLGRVVMVVGGKAGEAANLVPIGPFAGFLSAAWNTCTYARCVQDHGALRQLPRISLGSVIIPGTPVHPMASGVRGTPVPPKHIRAPENPCIFKHPCTREPVHRLLSIPVSHTRTPLSHPPHKVSPRLYSRHLRHTPDTYTPTPVFCAPQASSHCKFQPLPGGCLIRQQARLRAAARPESGRKFKKSTSAIIVSVPQFPRSRPSLAVEWACERKAGGLFRAPSPLGPFLAVCTQYSAKIFVLQWDLATISSGIC